MSKNGVVNLREWVKNRREKRSKRIRESMVKNREIREKEIESLIIEIARGKPETIRTLRKLISATFRISASKSIQSFLLWLRDDSGVPLEVLENAMDVFLVRALEKHNKKKGSKKAYFMGVLNRINEEYNESKVIKESKSNEFHEELARRYFEKVEQKTRD